MSVDYTDLLGPPSWLSECCGAVSWGELHLDEAKVQAVGICSGCKDHATFMPPDEPDSHPAVLHARLARKFTPEQDRHIAEREREPADE
jgi:hypothetical protein